MSHMGRQRYPYRSVSLRRRTIRRAGCAVAAGLLALAGPAPLDAQDAPMLVEYLPVTAQSYRALPGTRARALDDISRDPGVLSLRIGYATPEPVVHAGALSIELPGTGETLTIDDLVVEELDSGYALYSGDRLSETATTLVVMGADVIGTLRHDGELYGVQPLGDGLTAVYRYDHWRLRRPPETEPDYVIPDAEMREDSALPPPRAPPMARDSRDRIDVLVVYSAKARRVAGNIDARIALLVVDTHRAYANSEITTRLRVVHSYETPTTVLSDIDSNDKKQDLVRLRTRGDGFYDEVFAKREQYAADVVILLHGQQQNRCGGGIAYLLNHGPGSSEWAFGVSGIGEQVVCRQYDGDTFAHEIGHIQGASHNPEERGALDNPPYSYGHGFCNAARNWRTVMAYNTGRRCESRLPHFSNPTVRYLGSATGDATRRNVARVINETAIHVANFRQSNSQPTTTTKTLPFVPPASNVEQQGFVRIINHSDRDGVVRITAIDDLGQRRGPVMLSLEARAAKHFNSQDLEGGNSRKGLSGGVGDGHGNWRLELATDLEIEHLAYIRTLDGFVTNMHEVAAETQDGSNRYHVPFFNPGRNWNQESKLRLINPESGTASIEITGVDDEGRASPRGAMRLDLGAGRARMLTAYQIENGGSELSGGLGAGTGKWRLSVSADRPIQVMSLLSLRTGHLTNLSRGQEGASPGTPPPSKPDLVVQSPSVSNASPNAGQSFTLRATVRNQGRARSAETTLRYFRSSDATISTGDTRVGTDTVSGLAASGTSPESISLTAPSSAGTYWYGACVDAVSGESDTRNNCSSAVRVTVRTPTGTKASYCNSGSSRVGVIAAGWKGQYCGDGIGWSYRAGIIPTAIQPYRGLNPGAEASGLRRLRVGRGRSLAAGRLAYGESSSNCGHFGVVTERQRAAAEQDALSELSRGLYRLPDSLRCCSFGRWCAAPCRAAVRQRHHGFRVRRLEPRGPSRAEAVPTKRWRIGPVRGGRNGQ